MSLSAGTRLGPYEIRGPLGAGGMGEVYRACDTRLGRDVALKVLPAEFNQDPDRLHRFEQEARLAGSLNHPNVLTLFDVGAHEGAPYLVTELLEGRTLREVLAPGPLSPRKAVEYTRQIAGGLAAAHDRGVIHRDLKPANVFVTKGGQVKILDFGLAKLTQTNVVDTGSSFSTHTAEGKVVGTLGYMSPEQVRGHAVDARSDIFALGAVVYEMLSGRRAFDGETPADALSAILRADPPEITTATGPLASGLERIVRRCLEKEPGERFQSARDMAFALEALSASSRTDAPGPGRPVGWRRRWHLAGTALAAVAVAGMVLTAAVWLLRPPPPPKVRQVRRITEGIGAALAGGGGNWATVVTDGVRAYYIAAKGGVQGLWQVPVAGGDAVPIPLPFAGSPLFGYLRSQSALLTLGAVNFPDDFTEDGMALWLVPVPSGTPRRVGRLHAWAAGVSPDERRLAFKTKSALWLADIDGSGARKLLELPSELGSSIRWSPDGTRLRFSAPGEDDRPWIWETAVEKPALRPLWPGQQGEWVEDRRLYVFRRSGGANGFGLTLSASGSDLFAVPESRWPWERPRPAQITFGPIRFQSPVASGPGGPLLAWGEIAASELRRLDRRTRRFEPVLEGTSAAYAAWSPDGRQVAWVAYPEGTLWRGLAGAGERLQLTTAPLEVHQPRFSPDGRTIVFLGRTPEEPLRSVYVVSADGTDGGRPRLLARTLVEGKGCWEACWAADGQSVLFGHMPPDAMTRPAPGIYRVGVTGAPPEREPGAETLSLLACSRQGHVLADGPNGPAVRWAGRRQWEKAPVGLVSPTWTRDGRSICGLEWGASSVSRVACYSFDRSRLEPLATIDLPLLAVTNMPAMFLDPDDDPVVVVDRSVRDIYALEWNAP
jgi:Tol biopolymer transport system component